ncbi:predicted protein [Plenodomus lingam JN3]|uniref:Predicted protein n=1 Tax=Leptosphaeria maculans (strain JN3 / isolate v23.1.3 / race Av1-4-5-6-7-8) TaxID=985895 RepID=E4ZUX1_LEPMJ|nr:predicted protein [Plenodomus lingam JN3]CBX94908.1 predicted protein [Plenodomus lingam JN3]
MLRFNPGLPHKTTAHTIGIGQLMITWLNLDTSV